MCSPFKWPICLWRHKGTVSRGTQLRYSKPSQCSGKVCQALAWLRKECASWKHTLFSDLGKDEVWREVWLRYRLALEHTMCHRNQYGQAETLCLSGEIVSTTIRGDLGAACKRHDVLLSSHNLVDIPSSPVSPLRNLALVHTSQTPPPTSPCC